MSEPYTANIRPLRPGDAVSLGEFFQRMAADPEIVRFFHPHPLTPHYAAELCGQSGSRRDGYFIAEYKGRIVGYSMLRGWDEGYDVPSFGVCVDPFYRNLGLGKQLTEHAIEASRQAGAPKLRLTVYKENRRAVHVYRKFGFEFSDKNDTELLGVLPLKAA